MDIDKIINSVIVNRANPNVSRGYVEGLSITILNELHKWFNTNCFATKTIKETIHYVRDNVFKEPLCPECHNRVKPLKTFCSKSCASKQPKRNTERNRKARESIRYICGSCGKPNVKSKGYNCVSCGNKAQAKKIKTLWETDFNRMNMLCQKPRTLESRKKQSDKVKKLILDGKFTPKSNNRYTHRNARYDNIPFRSTWEQRVYRHFKDTLGITLEYETLRIKYDFDGKSHVYIVDFIDRKNKHVYEIKPNSMVEDREKAKEKALIEWTSKNGYTYEFISEDWINERNLFKKYRI